MEQNGMMGKNLAGLLSTGKGVFDLMVKQIALNQLIPGLVMCWIGRDELIKTGLSLFIILAGEGIKTLLQ